MMRKQMKSVCSVFTAVCVSALLLSGCQKASGTQNESGAATAEEVAGEAGQETTEAGEGAGAEAGQEAGGDEGAAVEILEGAEAAAPDYYSALSSFSAEDLDGNPVTEEIFAGTKLTMVNVWGTFCGPCIEEMPALGAIAASYDPAEFQIVGLVSDAMGWDGKMDAETVAAAKEIISQTGADYLHLVPEGELVDLLNELMYVPTTIFVNAEGRAISEEYVGSRSEEDWQAIIQSILNP